MLEQRPRARDPAEDERHLLGTEHLQPGRRELRPALDLEQRVRVGGDLVPPGHAPQSIGTARGRTAPSRRRAGTLCSLGVWRSLVARSVRVGEVPSSNLGTPIDAWGTRGSPASPSCRRARVERAGLPPGEARLRPGTGRRGLRLSSVRAACGSVRRRLHAVAARARARAGGVPARRRRTRARPRSRAVRGRAAGRARRICRAHPELVHDEEIWISVHRGHRPGHGRRRRRRARLRGRHGAPLGDPRQLRPLRRCAARARRAARATGSGSG